MFDTHNAVAERMPHGELIKKHADLIRHVHINEMDGRHPGTGTYDFSVPLQALKDVGYRGWLSLEVFQFEPSGEEIARLSSAYLRRVESGPGSGLIRAGAPLRDPPAGDHLLRTHSGSNCRVLSAGRRVRAGPVTKLSSMVSRTSLARIACMAAPMFSRADCPRPACIYTQR